MSQKKTKLFNAFKLKRQNKSVFLLANVKTLTVCSKALVSGHPSAVCIKCKLLCIMRRVMISVCLVSLSVLRYPHNVTYPSGCPHTLPSQIFARNIIKHDPHHMPAPAGRDAFKVCTDYNLCLLDLYVSESDCTYVCQAQSPYPKYLLFLERLH